MADRNSVMAVGGLGNAALSVMPAWIASSRLSRSLSDILAKFRLALILRTLSVTVLVIKAPPLFSVGPTVQFYRYAASRPPYCWTVPPRRLFWLLMVDGGWWMVDLAVMP